MRWLAPGFCYHSLLNFKFRSLVSLSLDPGQRNPSSVLLAHSVAHPRKLLLEYQTVLADASISIRNCKKDRLVFSKAYAETVTNRTRKLPKPSSVPGSGNGDRRTLPFRS